MVAPIITQNLFLRLGELGEVRLNFVLDKANLAYRLGKIRLNKVRYS